MNAVRIYNTFSEKKEVLKKQKKPVRFFVCGPTVYGHIHIGNARTYASFDTIVRYLRSRGYTLHYLQNITDIDDKIIKRASEEGMTPRALATTYTREYLKATKKLGIHSVDTYAKATDFIPQIVQQVQTLMKKGYAYRISDGYYYDISRFSDYGKLAKRTAAQADDGVSRIDENSEKRNKGDFCLWKFYKEGEPSWNTPLGKGRPGWHIEDTAITEHYFGPQYDVHGGGLDLLFPHHEAEIAQQEAASGKKPFVKIWMHAGLIRMGGRKMSKSLGNFTTLQDFLTHHSPLLFRWIVASNHYRSPLDFSDETISHHTHSFSTLRISLDKLSFITENSAFKGSHQKAGLPSLSRLLRILEKNFYEAMSDDFNSPAAIAHIFSFFNTLGHHFWKLTPKEARDASSLISRLLDSIVIHFPSRIIPRKVTSLIQKRESLRTRKQFTQADALRARINDLGYEVEDTPLGPFARSNMW